MNDIRTPDDLPPEDLPDVAAAELALGVLEGEERATALRRVLAEPGFAQRVETWRVYLAQLFDVWTEVAAPDGVFERVERSIDAPFAAAAPARGRFWPMVAGLTSVAAAGLLVFVVARPPQEPPPSHAPVVAPTQPLLVASLAPTAKGTAIAAVYDSGRGVLRLTAAETPAAGRSAELWVIGADKTPHSLGLLSAGATTRVTPASAIRRQLTVGATLAVTIEPAGGSPTGLPTGAIVLKGDLSRV
ncbi:anti-sigma factor domain-containing protein [Sphingomonas sp. NFR15]|uniref:anti-sigma factor n=1 Tax=Sphingomonas sp. NFR15 TaxID=1566282 RepID=UPI000886B67B|nr:anti-sigma factor [Sphingomonas sp. NFR15]SDA34890.1 Anti-sigma-K factor RskA [Sphingomonas sp. NFR15]